MDKKTSTPHTGFKPSTAAKDPVTVASKAPNAGADSDGIELSLPDTMTHTPKLPAINGMGHDVAHHANTSLHSDRFGTDTEKKITKAKNSANYGNMSDDCPSY